MLYVKGVIVFNLVTIVFTSPILDTFDQENVIQVSEVVSALDKELLGSKKSLEVKETKPQLINQEKRLTYQEGIVHDISKKSENKIIKHNKLVTQIDGGYKNIENLDDKLKNIDSKAFKVKYEKKGEKMENTVSKTFNEKEKNSSNMEERNNLMKNIIEQPTNSIDTIIEDSNLSKEEDLQRNPRQFNGMISPMIPVQMDSRFGPFNDGGLNYVQVSPDQIGNYMRQGVAIKEDLNKKITGQGSTNVPDGQTRNPIFSAPVPVYQYGLPQQQNHHQPVIVIQPIVIPALKEEDKKCPTLSLPIIKDKHPHIQLPSLPEVKPGSTGLSGLLNTPLIPSLLTTLLPALIPLLTKKKDEKKKPVIYLSKQFLINPNVVPSISIPGIKQNPKLTGSITDISLEKPTFKEVETFLDDSMGSSENKTSLSQEYLRAAIENEEIHLANLQNGTTDPTVGYTRASIPVNFKGRLLKRVTELDAEVGTVAAKLSELQNQQRLAHAIAATIG